MVKETTHEQVFRPAVDTVDRRITEYAFDIAQIAKPHLTAFRDMVILELGKNKYGFADGQLTPEDQRRLYREVKASQVFAGASKRLGIQARPARRSALRLMLNMLKRKEAAVYFDMTEKHGNIMTVLFNGVLLFTPDVTKKELTALDKLLLEGRTRNETIRLVLEQYVTKSRQLALAQMLKASTVNQARRWVEKMLNKRIDIALRMLAMEAEEWMLLVRSTAVTNGNRQLATGLTWQAA